MASASISELADAVPFFGLRGERQPWGAEDTAFVFLDTSKAALRSDIQDSHVLAW